MSGNSQPDLPTHQGDAQPATDVTEAEVIPYTDSRYWDRRSPPDPNVQASLDARNIDYAARWRGRQIGLPAVEPQDLPGQLHTLGFWTSEDEVLEGQDPPLGLSTISYNDSGFPPLRNIRARITADEWQEHPSPEPSTDTDADFDLYNYVVEQRVDAERRQRDDPSDAAAEAEVMRLTDLLARVNQRADIEFGREVVRRVGDAPVHYDEQSGQWVITVFLPEVAVTGGRARAPYTPALASLLRGIGYYVSGEPEHAAQSSTQVAPSAAPGKPQAAPVQQSGWQQPSSPRLAYPPHSDPRFSQLPPPPSADYPQSHPVGWQANQPSQPSGGLQWQTPHPGQLPQVLVQGQDGLYYYVAGSPNVASQQAEAWFGEAAPQDEGEQARGPRAFVRRARSLFADPRVKEVTKMAAMDGFNSLGVARVYREGGRTRVERGNLRRMAKFFGGATFAVIGGHPTWFVQQAMIAGLATSKSFMEQDEKVRMDVLYALIDHGFMPDRAEDFAVGIQKMGDTYRRLPDRQRALLEWAGKRIAERAVDRGREQLGRAADRRRQIGPGRRG